MATKQDYIPLSPNTFHVWQGNFAEHVEANRQRWEIPAEAVEELRLLHEEWQVVFPLASAKNDRTATNVRRRIDLQKAYTKAVRVFTNRYLACNPLVSDGEKLLMGLHVHKRTRTRRPAPKSSPEARVDTRHLQHLVYFQDRFSESRARPVGMVGCEVWAKFDSLPMVDSELAFKGIATRSPYRINFEEMEAGRRVYYKLRWVNTRGVTGAWSMTTSAIVG